jgi:hypothetical protein
MTDITTQILNKRTERLINNLSCTELILGNNKYIELNNWFLKNCPLVYPLDNIDLKINQFWGMNIIIDQLNSDQMEIR